MTNPETDAAYAEYDAARQARIDGNARYAAEDAAIAAYASDAEDVELDYAFGSATAPIPQAHTDAWYAADCPPDFPLPFTPADAGCIFDGVHGQTYNDVRVIELAVSYGFELAGDAAAAFEAYSTDSYADTFEYAGQTLTVADYFGHSADLTSVAIDYLNTLAPEGFTFQWVDGDFVLERDLPTRDDLSADAQSILDALDVQSGRELDFDPYSALCAMFDIANALYWLDANAVPAAWQFSPGMAGGLDYGRCAKSTLDNNGECQACGGECLPVLMALTACGIPADMIAWPYGQGNDPGAYAAGMRAERALIELGNALEPYAAMSEV